jgi:hypothetical protein
VCDLILNCLAPCSDGSDFRERWTQKKQWRLNEVVAVTSSLLLVAYLPRGVLGHPPFGHFGFSLRVTATMADGVSPAHTVRVIF